MVDKKENQKLAIILVRGLIGMNHDIRKTIEMLKLHRKNSCVVVLDNPVSRGMAVKVKDYTTYGIVDEETQKLLIEKRARKNKKGEIDNVFRLSPPLKGFERKGIKQPFISGGALGDRKEKINDLIKRMI